MALRGVRITLRDRQTTGGSIPSDALFGEPFVNLYDGILRFSGVTGGAFETSTQAGVFEVGSSLYNQKIANRLSINGNFIISGDTGFISTYAGASGGGLVGKFLSGTTAGLVLANISDIQGVLTYVQPGTNITTGGTPSLPIVSVVDSPSFNNITYSGTSIGGNSIATNVSATTFYSAGTNLETIIQNISGSIEDVTRVQPGTNTTTGGTVNLPFVNVVDSPSFNNITFSGTAIGGTVQAGVGTFTSLSAETLSGGTILSGSTNLYDIFATPSQADITRVQPGTNITTGGTANFPIVSVIDSPSFTGTISASGLTDTSLTSGRVVFVTAGGELTDEAGFTYDTGVNTLGVEKAAFGVPGQTGTTVTVYGDLLILGDAVNARTSQLYIEDNTIELNFNPTASTTSTSLGAGWSIQDGSGLSGTSVFLDIRGAATGVDNRSFTTNLADIRIRETGTVSAPNGAYLLASGDVLDAGSY